MFIVVQAPVQVEEVGPGWITTEVDQCDVGSMVTLAAHTPFRLYTGDVPLCVCVYVGK